MRLYELDRAYEEALELAVDHATGEIISADAEKRLDEITGERDAKALNIAALTVDFEAEAEKVAKRASELKARSTALYNRAEWLRRYLADHLPVGTKLKDDRVAFSVAPGAQRVNDIVDVAQLPDKYKAIETKVLKADILRDLKAGLEIPGAALMTGAPSVRIR
jgi:hypothetical protein